MRKLLVLGAALVALLSLVSIAQGLNGNDEAHIWFFGNCEQENDSVPTSLFLGDGCRGIGLFVGDWDKESIAEAITDEAYDEFGGYWYVEHLKALNLFGGDVQYGSNYGCYYDSEETSIEPQSIGYGLWIAIFSVEPCGYIPDEP